MSMKRYFSLVLAVVFVFAIALSGCGKTDPVTTSAAPSSSAPSSSAAESTKVDTAKPPVALTWYLIGSKQEPETDKICAEANKYLKDKINATIDLKVFGFGDPYNQKVNTMLAAGEAFDVAFTASWAADYRANSLSGYFTALDDYLKDSPIVQVLSQDFLNGAKVNGKTYAVQTNKEKVHNQGFVVKKELVDKYKLDITSIKKLEDMEPFFEQVKKNEKGITPLLRSTDESPFRLLDWDVLSDDGVPGALYPDNRDTKVINHLLAPESIAHYNKMREYSKKGYVSKDAATATGYLDLFKSGKFAALTQSLKPGKDAELQPSIAFPVIQIDVTKPVMTNRETTGAMLAIPSASKNKDAAFKFIEMLYTDKFLDNLFIYGIEGTHYNKVSDNVVKLIGGEKSGYAAGNGWRFGNQLNSYLAENEDPKKWEKFDEYNKAGLPMTSLGFLWDKKNVEAEMAACKTVQDKYRNQLQAGAVDVEPTVKKYEADLKKAGVEKLLADMQTQYDAWLKTK